MFAKKLSIKKALPIVLCSSFLVGIVPAISTANTNPGFSFIWGGRDSQPNKQLSYVLSDGTPGNLNTRWRMKLPSQEVAMSAIRISFPDYFNGTFNQNKIELRESPKSRLLSLKEGKPIAVASVTADNETGLIEIIPESPIPAGKKAEVLLKGVRNPRSGGVYFVNCSILSPGDVPVPKNIGTWVMSFFQS